MKKGTNSGITPIGRPGWRAGRAVLASERWNEASGPPAGVEGAGVGESGIWFWAGESKAYCLPLKNVRPSAVSPAA